MAHAFNLITTGIKENLQTNFSGGVVVGNEVIFVPAQYNEIGIFNTDTLKFRTIDISNDITSVSGIKFSGGAVVGNKVIFVPYNARNIGVYDVTTNTFSYDKETYSHEAKFSGAAVVGDKVIFAPYNADKIGVYDVTSDSFTQSPQITPTMKAKFSGASAIGNNVIFAPYRAEEVGIYDVKSDTYTYKTTKGLVQSGVTLYSGTTSLENNVILSSQQANVVCVYNNTNKELSFSPPINENTYAFSGACTIGNKVIFAPYNSNSIGIFDIGETNIYSNFKPEDQKTKTFMETNEKFNGAVSVGNKVIFIPKSTKYVGVFELNKSSEKDDSETNFNLILGLSIGLGLPVLAIIIILIIKDPANVIYKNKFT